jgi:hypothetical protein
MKVVANGAANAQSATVMPGFNAAPITVEVVGDFGAWTTCWLAIDIGGTGEQTILATGWAYAAGVNCVEDAREAKSAFWPGGGNAGDWPSASCAGVGALLHARP